ncbi:unnamed protein product [Pylaiella littoralis]
MVAAGNALSSPAQQQQNGSFFQQYTPAQHAAARAAAATAAAAAASAGHAPAVHGNLPHMGMGAIYPSPSSGSAGVAGIVAHSPVPGMQHPALQYSPRHVPLTHLPPPPPASSPLPPTPTIPAPAPAPLPPASPPKPIRDKQPSYEKDWLLSACQAEMRRRAEAAGDKKGSFKYGSEDGDINRSISNVKKAAAVQQLLAHDSWKVSQGLDPDWKQAPQGTPDAKRLAMQAKAAAEEAEEEEKRRARTSADAARLAFIVFSDEIYTKLLQSEQAPTDRNKRDLHQLGVKDPDGVWDLIVDYFLKEDLKLGGIRPGNPVSHAGSTAPGVDKMWEQLEGLDYKAPVKK